MDDRRSSYKTVAISVLAASTSAFVVWSLLEWWKRRKEQGMRQAAQHLQDELVEIQRELVRESEEMAEEVNEMVERRRQESAPSTILPPSATVSPPPTVPSPPPPLPASLPSRPSFGGSSMSSNEAYEDASEEWYTSPLSSPGPSTGQQPPQPVVDSASPPLFPITDAFTVDDHGRETAFEKLDHLIDEDTQAAYDEMKKLVSGAQAKDPEVLWRLAKACHHLAGDMDSKNPKKKERILEGRGYAQEAAKLDAKSFLVLKWAAILTGTATDYVGTKEKIEQGNSYLDQALAMDAKEFSLLHMRGRYAYSVANLSWLERKAAAAFFAAPPEATIDEALADFLAANEVRPNWMENLLYIARCYIAKKDTKAAVPFLQQASKIEAVDDSEKELLVEIKALLKKYSS